MKRGDLRDWLEDTKASGYAKFVYVGLLAHAGTDGRSWPSVPTLAGVLSLGTTTVRNALRELETAGEVVRHVQRGAPTVYELTAYPNVTRWTTPTSGVVAPQREALDNPNANPNANPNVSRQQKELKELKESENGASSAPPPTAELAPTFMPGTGWVTNSHDSDAPPQPEPKLDAATLREQRHQVIAAYRQPEPDRPPISNLWATQHDPTAIAPPPPPGGATRGRAAGAPSASGTPPPAPTHEGE